ncbi:MAG: DNA polymerase [Negativicutes bacterium]|nr:DNA polymerase [Negativicutes bacterium]
MGLLRDILAGLFAGQIITEGKDRLKCLMVGGSIIALEFKLVGRENKPKITLADSFCLLPDSLANLCGPKGFNLGSTKDDIPAKYKSDMGEYRRRYPERYHGYHKRDTELLLQIVSLYRDCVNSLASVGNLKLTCGATALAVFRTGFLGIDIITPGDMEMAFTRRCYQGGRCEYIGDGVLKDGTTRTFEGVNTYDINSEYPAAMAMAQFPIKPGVFIDTDYDFPRHEGEIAPGCYLVNFKQAHGRVAIIKPWDELSERAAKHAAWSGQAYITHIEAREIEAGGGTVHLIRGYHYPETAPIFADFVNTLYTLRMEFADKGNASMVLVIKLVMNNLYGKFGQKELRETFDILAIEDMLALAAEMDTAKGEKIEPQPHIHDNAFKITRVSQVRHAFPAIAAMVTAAGRQMLLEVPNQYNIPIIYCDTDSVHTQSELPGELVDKRRLGKFKLERSATSMAYGGRKIYIDLKEEKHKAKGVPQKSVSAMKLYAAIEKGEPYAVEYDAPTGIKTALRKSIDNPNKFLHYTRTLNRDISTVDLGLVNRTWEGFG